MARLSSPWPSWTAPPSPKIAAPSLELPEVVDIALQTARALREAHEKGVIHRDVKSANVMLTRRGQVKLTDFGLARLASQQITSHRKLQGTPAYMSPEQIHGEPVDHRTDIWSLGVMIYEMVTGGCPSRATTARLSPTPSFTPNPSR